MSLISAVIILHLTGMMSVMACLMIIEEKYLPKGVIRPEVWLYFGFCWPYFYWLIFSNLFDDN